MQQNQMIKSTLEFIKTIAIVLVLAFIIKTFFIQTFIIDGQSMEPNFHNGEYLLVDKFSYHITQPKRGDVDIIIPPDDISKDYIKRIIGVPGDTVEIKSGKVFINNKEIKEPYLPSNTPTLINGDFKQSQKITLKDNQYYVLGDNRGDSRDSRYIGIIPKENIIGRTLLIAFPFKNAQVISRYDFSANS
jgi:signal peptidase I